MVAKIEFPSRTKCRFDGNLVVLCTGWIILYSSFSSIKDVSSSINHENGVGFLCMTSFYIGYFLACVFATPILDYFNSKTSISLNALFQIPLVLSFVFPALYISAPLSFLGGFSQALLWTSSNSYLTWIAHVRSFSINTVFSIFYVLSSFAPFVGGLSAVFVFSVNDFNDSKSKILIKNATNYTVGDEKCGNFSISNPIPVCGSEFCYADQMKHLKHLKLTNLQLYFAVGFFVLFMLLAVLILLFFLDKSDITQTSGDINKQCLLLDICAILKERHLLNILLLIFYFGYQLSFFSGSFLQGYVACQYGFGDIGYYIAAYGLSSALSSGSAGVLKSRIGRTCLIVTGCFFNIGALVGMFLLEQNEYYRIITISLVILWGIPHGIYQTQLNGWVGEAFPQEKMNTAFASFNLTLSLGCVLGYISANFLCMRSRLYTSVTLCLASTTVLLMSQGLSGVVKTLNKKIRKSWSI